MIGKLYYDNDKNKELQEKILLLVEDCYLKSNKMPSVVEVNIKDYSEDIIISGIKIRPSKYVMKNCFFIGWDEPLQNSPVAQSG